MNLSKHIEVTKRQWDYWKTYLKSSGYELEECPVDAGGNVQVNVRVQGEISADLAMCRIKNPNGRWTNYITIRIPEVMRRP